MTRDQIVTTVLSRLGRQEGNAYLVAQAQLELGLIQDQLEGDGFLPWFIISTEQSAVLTPTVRSLALPSDFLREYEPFPVYRYDATQADPYTRLTKDEFDVLESQYGGSSTDAPMQYALEGVSLEFFPTPDLAYNIRWKYYQKQTALSAGVQTNAWTTNASDLLIAKLGAVMAAYKKDQFWAQKFATDEQRAFDRIHKFSIAREQALRAGTMGDPEN